MSATIHHGDCLDALRTMPDNSVDAVITDPPYGLSNTSPDKVADTIVKWASGDREHVPTGKGFMGAEWDAFVPPPAVWDECLRVLKPGGHMAVFAGSRTQDLMGMSIRLAGFDLRDSVAWLYGSGFPKSLDVSKAIDKMGGDPLAFRRFAKAYAEAVKASEFTHTDIDRHLGIKSSSCYWAREDHRGGMPPRHHWEQVRDLMSLDGDLESLYDEAERAVIGTRKRGFVPDGNTVYGQFSGDERITAPASDAAKQWSGWGTALKPGHEPIILARKPFPDTVAANVLTWGTGGLNIDATRIESDGPRPTGYGKNGGGVQRGAFRFDGFHTLEALEEAAERGGATPTGRDARVTLARHRLNVARAAEQPAETSAGRWPANVVLDPDAAKVLDQQSGTSKSHGQLAQDVTRKRNNGIGLGSDGVKDGAASAPDTYGDTGGASRYFKVVEPDPPFMYASKAPKRERPSYTTEDGQTVQHSTVKPLSIMQWLVKLVTPEGGTVLDPFAGSGTTVEAAILEGFHVIGIEREAEYLPLIQQRIDRATPGDPEPTETTLLDLITGDAA